MSVVLNDFASRCGNLVEVVVLILKYVHERRLFGTIHSKNKSWLCRVELLLS